MGDLLRNYLSFYSFISKLLLSSSLVSPQLNNLLDFHIKIYFDTENRYQEDSKACLCFHISWSHGKTDLTETSSWKHMRRVQVGNQSRTITFSLKIKKMSNINLKNAKFNYK